MENQPNNQKKGIAASAAGSPTAKFVFIGFLALALSLPSFWVSSLIQERQGLQNETITEITRNWGTKQKLAGPVLIVPYTYQEKVISDKKESVSIATSNLYLLPEVLEVSGAVTTELLHRSIYDAVVYNSKLKVSGRFGEIDLSKSGILPENLQWNRARIALGITDLKGLKTNPDFTFGSETYPIETDSYNTALFSNTLVVTPDFKKHKGSAHPFSFTLDLRGSSALFVMPLGKNNKITLKGNWPDPKFEGDYLPENRKVTANGFQAAWSVPYFNRNVPQQWLAKSSRLPDNGRPEADNAPLHESSTGNLGIKFLLPVDNYQKTTRAVKYSLLIISLTFIALFFTEVLTKRPIHPIQYMLIGAALIMYYSLLLAFSEYTGFNIAYVVASTATVLLIALFLKAVLKSGKTALIFSGILSSFYLFIFTLMQLETLSLLVGSVGLFFIIATLMYFSGRLNWRNS